MIWINLLKFFVLSVLKFIFFIIIIFSIFKLVIETRSWTWSWAISRGILVFFFIKIRIIHIFEYQQTSIVFNFVLCFAVWPTNDIFKIWEGFVIMSCDRPRIIIKRVVHTFIYSLRFLFFIFDRFFTFWLGNCKVFENLKHVSSWAIDFFNDVPDHGIHSLRQICESLDLLLNFSVSFICFDNGS